MGLNNTPIPIVDQLLYCIIFITYIYIYIYIYVYISYIYMYIYIYEYMVLEHMLPELAKYIYRDTCIQCGTINRGPLLAAPPPLPLGGCEGEDWQ